MIERACLLLCERLREASDRLSSLTSEAKALTKAVEQGAYERAAAAQQPQKVRRTRVHILFMLWSWSDENGVGSIWEMVVYFG
jgi:hypothetical protein